MQKVVKMTVAVASSLSIAAAGLAGVAGASSVTTSGTDAQSKINNSSKSKTDIYNHNNVGATNNNVQGAHTGEVNAKHNTTVGDVGTGNASAKNDFKADLTFDNSGSSGMGAGSNAAVDSDGDVLTSGTDAKTSISNKTSDSVKIDNYNNAKVVNNNTQKVSSGKVDAVHNTTVGDVTTGDASAEASSTTTFNFTN